MNCDNIDRLPVDNSYVSDQDKYLLSTLFPVKESVSVSYKKFFLLVCLFSILASPLFDKSMKFVSNKNILLLLKIILFIIGSVSIYFIM